MKFTLFLIRKNNTITDTLYLARRKYFTRLPPILQYFRNCGAIRKRAQARKEMVPVACARNCN